METMRVVIERAILSVIARNDDKDHNCMARSEGDICCCDPRPTQAYIPGSGPVGEPKPGLAVQEGLIDAIAEAVTKYAEVHGWKK